MIDVWSSLSAAGFCPIMLSLWTHPSDVLKRKKPNNYNDRKCNEKFLNFLVEESQTTCQMYVPSAFQIKPTASAHVRKLPAWSKWWAEEHKHPPPPAPQESGKGQESSLQIHHTLHTTLSNFPPLVDSTEHCMPKQADARTVSSHRPSLSADQQLL